MAEFNAVANLQAEVDQSSLRSAKREIERELGDVEVGVSSNRPTGGGAVGSSGPERAGVDLSRRQLGALEGLEALADERNELLEELVGDGGGGGGVLRAGGGSGGLATGAAGGVAGGLATAGGVLSALVPLLGITGGASLGAGLLTQEVLGVETTGGQSPATRDTELTNLPEFDFGQLFGGELPVGRGAGPGGDVPQTQNFARGRERDLMQQIHEAGGAQNFNINPNVNVNAQGVSERQVSTIVERQSRQMAEEIRRQLERAIGGGASSRTAGNPAGPVGGPGSSGPTPF